MLTDNDLLYILKVAHHDFIIEQLKEDLEINIPGFSDNIVKDLMQKYNSENWQEAFKKELNLHIDLMPNNHKHHDFLLYNFVLPYSYELCNIVDNSQCIVTKFHLNDEYIINKIKKIIKLQNKEVENEI